MITERPTSTLREPDVEERARALLNRKSFRHNVQMTVSLIIIVVGSIVVLIPLAWMLSTAFKSDAEVFILPIRWIPRQIQFSNFVTATSVLPFWGYMINSVHITVLVVLGSVISSSLVAFAFARLRSRWR